MDKVSYDIEFSHFGIGEKFSVEHLKSVAALKSLLILLKKSNTSFRTSILVDDYNFSFSHFEEVNPFLSEIQSLDAPISYIAKESYFCSLADALINSIPESQLVWEPFSRGTKKVLFLTSSSVSKIALKEVGMDGHNRYSCPTLSSVWLLCRLGVFEFPQEAVRLVGDRSLVKEATQAVAILPKKFELVEKKVSHIIRATPYSLCLNRVSYVFI